MLRTTILTSTVMAAALLAAGCEQKKTPVDVLVVATVGGMEQQQLQFLVKRAAKQFATAEVIGFEFHQPGDHEVRNEKNQNPERFCHSVRELLTRIRNSENSQTAAASQPRKIG